MIYLPFNLNVQNGIFIFHKMINTSNLRIAAVLFMLFFPGKSFADFKWSLGGALSETYDDNVTYEKERKIESALTRLTLGGGFTKQEKNNQIVFKTSLTGNMYTPKSSYNNLSETADLDVVKDFSPYDRVSLSESFRHADDPRSFEDAFGQNSGRYSRYTNNIGVKYARILTKQLTVTLKYGQSNVFYSRKDLSNTVQFTPGLSAEYAINSANIILGSYDYVQSSYENGGKVRVNSFSGGLRHFFTEQWYLDLMPGVSLINAYDGPGSVKPRYSAVLTHDVDENTSLKLTYTQEYAANTYSQNVFNSYRWVLSGVKQLTARLSSNISAFYGQGEYQSTGIDDKLSGLSAGLGYAMTEKITLTLNYSYERTESNTDSRDYVRNMVSLGSRFAF